MKIRAEHATSIKRMMAAAPMLLWTACACASAATIVVRDIIERAGLRQRRVLTIPNPGLSPETPLARSELWYNQLQEK
ncbi:hypothetical protein [Rugamonas sp.]|uniref:hypothetical protein n=1 Tax=Rugamonas sp. TaxID=1926287 RepID=UPI0025ECA531|nr:hypothetical protein [Rugamonas sp.]